MGSPRKGGQHHDGCDRYCIGSALLILCLAAGLGLTFYAMFKYNKGIF